MDGSSSLPPFWDNTEIERNRSEPDFRQGIRRSIDALGTFLLAHFSSCAGDFSSARPWQSSVAEQTRTVRLVIEVFATWFDDVRRPPNLDYERACLARRNRLHALSSFTDPDQPLCTFSRSMTSTLPTVVTATPTPSALTIGNLALLIPPSRLYWPRCRKVTRQHRQRALLSTVQYQQCGP